MIKTCLFKVYNFVPKLTYKLFIKVFSSIFCMSNVSYLEDISQSDH